MSDKKNNQDWIERIDRFLDGGVNEQELRQLEAWLVEFPEMRRLYWQRAAIHGALRELHQELAGEAWIKEIARADESGLASVPESLEEIVRGGVRLRPAASLARTGVLGRVGWIAGALAACLLGAVLLMPGVSEKQENPVVSQNKGPEVLPVNPLDVPIPVRSVPFPLAMDPAPIVLKQPGVEAIERTGVDTQPGPLQPPLVVVASPSIIRADPDPNSEKKTPLANSGEVVAELVRTTPGVWIERGGERWLPSGPEPLLAGDLIHTHGFLPSAELQLSAEATRIRLSGDTRCRLVLDRGNRLIEVQAGQLTCEVAKQKPDDPLVFETPHARATVLGTVLQLRADPDRSRLEVTEGRVRFADRATGKFVDTEAGFFAEILAGSGLARGPLTAPDVLAQLPQTFGVQRVSLVDAGTGRELPGFENLTDGMEIDLSRLPTRALSIRADTAPPQIGSVQFSLVAQTDQGRFETSLTESVWPYFIAGDRPDKRIGVWDPVPGEHELVVRPFQNAGGRGRAGEPLRIRFRVVSAPPPAVTGPPKIEGFLLIQASSGRVARVLVDGGQIAMDEATSGLNIQVQATDAVQSVIFKLDEKVIKTKSEPPFTAGGDIDGVHQPLLLAVGMHTLRAVPCSQPRGEGERGEAAVVKFEVVRRRTR